MKIKEKKKLMRLDKLLADALPASRRQVREMIAAGLVSVNGRRALSGEEKVVPETACIEAEGRKIVYQKFLYLMMNKPAGVVSAARDGRDKTALSLLPAQYYKAGLFIAGRLDKDTEGFLFITNDGDLGHRVTSPVHHADKQYYILTDLPPSEEDRAAFLEGIVLEDGVRCRPAELILLPEEEGRASLLTLREGKFHQVKRMMEARGKRVVYLKRLKIGGVELDPTLRPGEFRPLSEEELLQIKGACGG